MARSDPSAADASEKSAQPCPAIPAAVGIGASLVVLGVGAGADEGRTAAQLADRAAGRVRPET